MLNLLRKYQKGIFIVTSIIVIFSFSFFGTYNVIGRSPSYSKPKEKEIIIGHAIDGSKLTRNKVDKLLRFLSTDYLSQPKNEKDPLPNIFNDGVIAEDILSSKIALVLAKHYHDYIEQDIALRSNQFKTYKPYVHPSAPFISAYSLWEKFLPTLAQKYSAYMEAPMDDPLELFKRTSDLYLAQRTFPGAMLRQLLLYMQNQYGFVEKDPYLEYGDFNIFYASSLEDWFGSNFMQIVAQFIINCARFAEENGFEVSKEEAKASLFEIGKKSLQAHMKEVNDQDVELYLHRVLAIQNLTETEALDIWKDVLLFRRAFKDAAESVFVDPVMYEDFIAYSANEAHISLYELPKMVHFENAQDLMMFEEYLQGIIQDPKKSLEELSSNLLSLDAVKEKSPYLIGKTLQVNLIEATLNEVALSIPVKDLWEFEISDYYWEQLCVEFPQFQDIFAPHERLSALKALSHEKRDEIDRKCKEQMVVRNLNWAQKLCSNKQSKETSLSLPLYGAISSIEGFASGNEFLHFLDNYSLGSVFTKDNTHFYVIQNFSQGEEYILSYEQALEAQVLPLMQEERLLQLFETKKKNDGAFAALGFKEAKNTLKEQLYHNTFEDIKKNLAHQVFISGLDLSNKDAIAKYRFIPLLKALQSLPESTRDEPLLKQFIPQKQELALTRSQYAPLPDDQFFRMKPDEISDIFETKNQTLAFFIMNDQKVNNQALADEINKGKELLMKESSEYFAQSIVQELKEKNAIVLPDFNGLIADDS